MIEQDLTDVLEADSTIDDIVGGRVYPMAMPQNSELPAIVYSRVSTTPVTSIDGDTGLDYVRFEISCYAKSLLDAKNLAAAVRAAINASELKSVPVMWIDMQDPDTKSYRSIIDFNIWQR